MTHTVLYAHHAPTAGTCPGKRTPAVPFLMRRLLEAGQAIFAAPVVSTGPTRDQAVESCPWLTATIRCNMGVRAQRLMRADY